MIATSDLEAEKHLAAEAAVQLVQSGMTVGLGSGSTAEKFVRLLGVSVRSGDVSVQGVATSRSTTELARAVGIEVIAPTRGLRLDLTVDGADEIAPELALIKGGGGALLREKVVARASDRVVIIADSSKLVTTLGTFPLPVEAVPFAVPWVIEAVESLGATVSLRGAPGAPFETEQGNWILDCRFGQLADPHRIAAELDALAGVAEHGLFLDIADTALVGDGTSVRVLRRKP